MSLLSVLSTLILCQCFISGWSQTIRGTVWEDWNADGIRQDYEPGFAYATVQLLYQPEGETNFFLNGTNTETLAPLNFFTLSDGQYYFDCLGAGNYSIQVIVPAATPSNFSRGADSKITVVNGNTGSTPFFTVSSGGIQMDAGVVPYVFLSLFSMTGRNMVPQNPDTNLGTTYSIFDARTNTLYYRVERGPWEGWNVEYETGFLQGYPGQDGIILRLLADRSSTKTNYWVITSPSIISDLYSGNMYVLILANGSYSDQSGMRGNWTPLRNSQYVQTNVTLLGESVMPTPVSTSAMGSFQVTFNWNANYFTYSLSLSDFGTANIQTIGLYGPASTTSDGPSLKIALSEGSGQVNVSSIPNFGEYLLTNQLYIQVSSDQYPTGQIRAQIDGFSQVVYTTSSFTEQYGVDVTWVTMALSLDTSQHTLSYYFLLTNFGIDPLVIFLFPNSTSTEIVSTTTTPDGLYVTAQGFFWNLSPAMEQKILNSGGFGSDNLIIQFNAFGSIWAEISPINWY